MDLDCCSGCQMCVVYNRKNPSGHSCLEIIKPPRRPGALPKPVHSLQDMLKKKFTKQKWRKLRGKTNYGGNLRPKIIKSAWGKAQAKKIRVSEAFENPHIIAHQTTAPKRKLDLVSTPCRITTAVDIGPQASRHTFNPIEAEVKTIPEDFTITPERALELTREQQRRRLASFMNLALGGHSNIQGFADLIGLDDTEAKEPNE